MTAAKIRRGAVTSSKIKDGQVKGVDVDVASLPPVPKARAATRADVANGAEVATRAAEATRAALATRAETATYAERATNAGRAWGTPAADHATILWASVTDGAKLGHGVKSISTGPGGAVVTFDRPIRDCASFATISSDTVDYSSVGYDGIGAIQTKSVLLPGVEDEISVITTLPDGKNAGRLRLQPGGPVLTHRTVSCADG